MGRQEDQEYNVVYLVDFGLAKEHINKETGKPHLVRKNTDLFLFNFSFRSNLV